MLCSLYLTFTQIHARCTYARQLVGKLTEKVRLDMFSFFCHLSSQQLASASTESAIYGHVSFNLSIHPLLPQKAEEKNSPNTLLMPLRHLCEVQVKQPL